MSENKLFVIVIVIVIVIQTLSHGPDVSDTILLFSVYSKSPECSRSEGYHMSYTTLMDD